MLRVDENEQGKEDDESDEEELVQSVTSITTIDGSGSVVDTETTTTRSTTSSHSTAPSSLASSSPESEWETHSLPITLLAKLPLHDSSYPGYSEALRMLKREGTFYANMPLHLSEAREGYIQTKPMQQPMPCAAAVPKFYGMYRSKKNEDGSGEKWMILMEECGRQVRQYDGHGEDLLSVTDK